MKRRTIFIPILFFIVFLWSIHKLLFPTNSDHVESTETPTIEEQTLPVVMQDKVTVVGSYCIENKSVLHYTMQRWHSDRSAYMSITEAHSKPVVWNIVVGECE